MRGRLLVALFVLGLIGVGAAVAGANRKLERPRERRPGGARARHAGTGAGDLPSREGRERARLQARRREHRERLHGPHPHADAGCERPDRRVALSLDHAGPRARSAPGRTAGVLAEGTITAANLIGPLTGHPLGDLVDAMSTGRAYVNLHTNDGVDGMGHRARATSRAARSGPTSARRGAPRSVRGGPRPPRTILAWATGTRSASRSGWASPRGSCSRACSRPGATGSSPPRSARSPSGPSQACSSRAGSDSPVRSSAG